jgi:hypothetical protein
MTSLPMSPEIALDLMIGIVTKNPDVLTGLAYDQLRDQVESLSPAERIDVIADTLQNLTFELIKLRGALAAGRMMIKPL